MKLKSNIKIQQQLSQTRLHAWMVAQENLWRLAVYMNFYAAGEVSDFIWQNSL